MTRLLVSVRNAVEAVDALAGGADIIDVKEPARGSLGRADASVVQNVVEFVGNRAPISMALGELSDLSLEMQDFDFAGLRFAKVGLAKCQSDAAWIQKLTALWRALPGQVAPVAVVYADWQPAEAPSPETILQVARDFGVHYLLVDTFRKATGRLLDHWPLASLREFAFTVAAANCQLVLAGSLDLPGIDRLLPLNPWALAVRGAVCDGGRESALSTSLVKQVREWISREG